VIILLQLFDFYEVNNPSNHDLSLRDRICQEHRSPSADGFDYCNDDDNDIKNDLRRRSIMIE